jgi:putative transposase
MRIASVAFRFPLSNSTKKSRHCAKATVRIRGVYRECLDAALHRLELAYRAFFRRVKQGQTPGFPRFKSFRRWDQLEFPHGNRALIFEPDQCRVRIPGAGWVKNRKGRTVPTYGRAWIVRKNSRWYACFECERAVRSAADRPHGVVGIDRGVHVLVATSDGRLSANPRPLRRLGTILARCQRSVSRKKRGGKNRRKGVGILRGCTSALPTSGATRCTSSRGVSWMRLRA